MKRKGKAVVVGVAGLMVAGLTFLPQAGSHAETGASDDISITIEPGCTFIAESSDDAERTVTIGQGTVAKDIEGVTFNVTCNGRDFEGTWALTARGDSEAKITDGAGHEIPSSNGQLDGSSSNWAMKMTVSGAAKIEEGYLDYTKVPTEDTRVASNRGDLASGDAKIQALYGISAQAEQEAGTYSGQVLYTLTNSASN